MPTAQEFVEQIAKLDDSEKLAEGIQQKVETLEQESLDPSLFKDDALAYFKYDGSEERNKQVDYLTEIRNQLEPRFTDIEGLGHTLSTLSIVGIDKLLNLLDGLLQIREISKIRAAIAGPCQALYKPAMLMTEISDAFGETMDVAQQIADAVSNRQLAGIADKVTGFDGAKQDLQTKLNLVQHAALKRHLSDWTLVAANKFNGGSVCRDARTAAANRITSDFRSRWEADKKTAGKQFEALTKARGKKLKLDSVIKFDQGMGPAVKKMEEAHKKGKDFQSHRNQAVTAATTYLRAVESLPDKLKTATPDFYTTLHSCLVGLVTSLQEYA